MANRAKLVNIELSELGDRHQVVFDDIPTGELGRVRFLLFWLGVPVQTIELEALHSGPLSARDLYDRLIQSSFPHSYGLLCQEMLRQRLLMSEGNKDLSSWLLDPSILADGPPTPKKWEMTIAVCIRAKSAPDSPTLQALFSSLAVQRCAVVQILVVEYGGTTAAVRDLVSAQSFEFEYVRVDGDALGLAQRVAVEKARGEVVGFVGDRTLLDSQWSAAVMGILMRNPEVALVAGLTLPQSIETDRRAWHEAMYGKAHGLVRRWIHWSGQPDWTELGVMQYGSDVNFAVRRDAFQARCSHDWRLGDGLAWPMMASLLLQGETIVYEPRAIVRIEVPDHDADIEAKVYGEIRSFYRYLKWVAGLGLRSKVVTLGLWKASQVLINYVKGYGLPRSWFRSELCGIKDELLARSDKSGRTAPNPQFWGLRKFMSPQGWGRQETLLAGQVETIDLSQPLQPIETNAKLLRLYVKWCDRLLGFVEIPSYGKPVGVDRICDTLVDRLLIQILAIPFEGNAAKAWPAFERSMNEFFAPPIAEIQAIEQVAHRLPSHIPVTIIVPTCNRPDDLRNCLKYLHRIQTDRPIEIIVADNRPKSGTTETVLREFPKVKLIEEPRPGSSYARNAAIVASTGDIVVTIDDDVTVPADWLEKLLVPFTRPEVMSVCGGVLPLVLDTPAQLMFEQVKGGLCFGYEKREANKDWLDSFTHGVPPIWELGVSANSAFRSMIFSDPTIGLMEETLGAGMPTAGAEENHYSYKILRAGHTIVYDPSAYVWHHHRQTLKAFYKQVQGQMVSCPALNLTLWLKEGDLRGRQQLLWNMPAYFWQCWRDRLLNKTKTPWVILFYEFKGYVIGFRGYFQSQKQVKKQGRSEVYVVPSDR